MNIGDKVEIDLSGCEPRSKKWRLFNGKTGEIVDREYDESAGLYYYDVRTDCGEIRCYEWQLDG